MAFSFAAGTLPFAYAQNDTDTASGVQDTDKKEEIKPLKDVCEDFFRVGTRADYKDIQDYGDFIKTHYNSITPITELVPENIIDKDKCREDGNKTEIFVSFNENTDTVLSFCEENNISIRGNSFVWYSMTPVWFFTENFDMNSEYVSPEVMDQRLESFIKNTFALLKEKYPKLKIEAYDVCKELFVNDGGGYRPAENNFWMRVYNDNSFVFKAYKYAREYAPEGCKLFYSDYNEYMPDKCDDIYNLASGLANEGLIDGIGMEGYLTYSYPSVDELFEAYYDYKSLGLEVQFTELNLYGIEIEKVLAERYADVFRMCMQNKETTDLITFELPSVASDDEWRITQPNIERLFDENLQPTQSYYRLCELVDEMKQKESEREKVGQTGLKDIYKGFFKSGAVVDHITEIRTDADFIKKNYNSLTPSLSPDMILDLENTISSGSDTDIKVDLEFADEVLSFCEDNGISIRGNCFVWYSRTPSWFFRENFDASAKLVSPEVMDQRLESFIKNTFAEIKEKYPKLVISSYDVCEEVFKNDTGELRPADINNWMAVYGDDSYIINAYKYARQYAPSECKLYLSDYNEFIPEKRDAIAALAASLKELGVLDGIAMQSWLSASYPAFYEWQEAFDTFVALGLDIEITSLDMTWLSYYSSSSKLTKIIKYCLENKDHISSITMSAPSDYELTLDWGEKKDDVLFDYQRQPKQAFYDIYYIAEELRTDDDSVLDGDANSDGVVNAADLYVFMNYLLLKDDVKYSESALDMNGDGKVNIVDLIMLKTKLLES